MNKNNPMKSHSPLYIAKCHDYDSKKIYDCLHEYFQLMGGIKNHIKPGIKVLVKPNMCSGHSPENAVTTHPILLEQIVNILMEQGADVTIGDNPIGQVEKKLLEKIWDVTGFNEVIKKTGCRKSVLDNQGFEKFCFSLKGKHLQYLISKECLEADIVFNVPKFKTHTLMGFTGAIKNMLGIVPGRSKVQMHSFAPTSEDFSKVLVEVFSHRVPEYTVMDAIDGIEGDGPTTRGIKRKIGFLMISNDAVLVDATCTRLIGQKIDSILTNRDAQIRGLGFTKASQIYYQGDDSLSDFTIPDFKMPTSFGYKNEKVIQRQFDIAKLTIRIDKKKCVKCMRCKDICPMDAIYKIDDFIALDKNKCIQCMCCLEICPEGAIEVSKSKFYQQLKQLRQKRAQSNQQSK